MSQARKSRRNPSNSCYKVRGLFITSTRLSVSHSNNLKTLEDFAVKIFFFGDRRGRQTQNGFTSLLCVISRYSVGLVPVQTRLWKADICIARDCTN